MSTRPGGDDRPALRHRAEAGFGDLARWAHRQPGLVIAFYALALAGASWALLSIRFDNTAESYLHPDDPSRMRYEAFRERYGRDDGAMVGIDLERRFEIEDLERLVALHEEIEGELVQAEEVKSLFNVRTQRGDGEELLVEDLLEEMPSDEAELAELRARIETTPLYHNLFVSDAGDFLTILVRPLSHSPDDDASGLAGFDDGDGDGEKVAEAESATTREGLGPRETEALVDTLAAIVARHDAEGFRTYLVGTLPYNVSMARNLGRDMAVCGGLTAFVMALILFALFRRVSGVVLPLVVVFATVVYTLGFAAAVDIPISVTTQVIPVFLLCVGICTSMHILALFYRAIDEHQSSEEAIAFAVEHSGLAILMASLTTAGGLFSFYFSELLPVAHLGIVGPVGVLLTFVSSVTLLPALLSISPTRPVVFVPSEIQERHSERLLLACGRLAARRPGRVLVGAALLFGVFCLGLLRLELAHEPIHWFPAHDPLFVSVDVVNKHLGATEGLEVLLESPSVGGFTNPKDLGRLAAAGATALGFSMPLETAPGGALRVSSATSLANVVQESHRALNGNRAAFYRIPDTREAIAQELLLFESSGADDLEKLTDSEYRQARLRLRVPLVDAVAYPRFVSALSERIRETVGPEFAFELTGTTEVLSSTLSAMIQSHIRSYVIALCIITPMMILMIGDLRHGLLSMIPNLIPVVGCLALMGWLGIRLDGSTLLVGAIVLGLAVDDTIHFMHKFRGYFEKYGDAEAAINETLRTTGLAMLFTSITITLGFASFGFAHMVNAQAIGLLVAFAAIVALAADVLVAPAMMALLHRPARGIVRGEMRA